MTLARESSPLQRTVVMGLRRWVKAREWAWHQLSNELGAAYLQRRKRRQLLTALSPVLVIDTRPAVSSPIRLPLTRLSVLTSFLQLRDSPCLRSSSPFSSWQLTRSDTVLATTRRSQDYFSSRWSEVSLLLFVVWQLTAMLCEISSVRKTCSLPLPPGPSYLNR